MTVNTVTKPVPPNGNLAYAMFVWVPQVGGISDPLGSDANQQSLLNFCSANGVNTLFLDVYAYLGGANFNISNVRVYQKFIHFAHASGINVYALCGDVDWQRNQKWVFGNIVNNIIQYQNSCFTNSVYSTPGSQFDGVCLISQYWAQAGGYISSDVTGTFDLIKSIKNALAIPVGFAPTVWQADPLSAALTVTYNGFTDLEGKVLMTVADFCAVQNYYNNSTTQTNTFQNWYNFATTNAAVNPNFGLYNVSLTDSGFGTQSYWTGASGAKVTLSTAQTAISTAFHTNSIFKGSAVEQYSSYILMT